MSKNLEVSIPVMCEVDRENWSQPKLVPKGGYWRDRGAEPPCCIHGLKLRWHCDYCEEYYESELSAKVIDELQLSVKEGNNEF